MDLCRILLLVHIAAAALFYPIRLSAQPLPTPLPAQTSNEPEKLSTHPQAEELARTLADTGKAHGTDAVALQAAFLLRAIEAGAVGPTEVKVSGPSLQAPEEYLRYEVTTGLIFDSHSTTSDSRLGRTWSAIVLPSLDRLETIDIKPPGLEVQLSYSLQAYDKNHTSRADPQMPSQPRIALIRISPTTLADFVAGAIDNDKIVSLSPATEAPSPAGNTSVR